MQEGNKNFGMLQNMQFGRVAYITVDFMKLVGDLFHTGSALVESE